MSQENVDVVRRFEEAMVAAIDNESSGGEGDFASILALLDEEVVIHGAASLPHGAEQVGHAGFFKLGELFSENWTFIEKPTFVYRDAGDVVLLHATFVLSLAYPASECRSRWSSSSRSRTAKSST